MAHATAPFEQGDLVYSRRFQPLLKSYAEELDWEEWNWAISMALREHDDDWVPACLQDGTPGIVGEQQLFYSSWRVWIVTPIGRGWVETQYLRKTPENDRTA